MVEVGNNLISSDSVGHREKGRFHQTNTYLFVAAAREWHSEHFVERPTQALSTHMVDCGSSRNRCSSRQAKPENSDCFDSPHLESSALRVQKEKTDFGRPLLWWFDCTVNSEL
jgi:hypothetical protein